MGLAAKRRRQLFCRNGCVDAGQKAHITPFGFSVPHKANRPSDIHSACLVG